MRIAELQASALKESVRAILPHARVYLFGSRADDTKRGGDIDVLVVGDRQLDLLERVRIKRAFYNRFGEQKIDIVSFAHEDRDPFREIAEAKAILL